MALFGHKRPTLSRQEILSARPIRNPRAEINNLQSDRLEVTIPFQKPRGLTWFFRGKNELKRTFELDRLGRTVWDLCNGEHTVRGMIEDFAAMQGLSTREAEVSMLAFLETLGRRGIIFMATDPKPPQADAHQIGRAHV